MPYPSKQVILDELKALAERVRTARQKFSNHAELGDQKIDPMMPLLHVGSGNMKNMDEWFDFERERRIDKVISGHVGMFHQNILASLPGWTDPGLFDLRNDEKRIIVEVKNKHNTMNDRARKDAYQKAFQFLEHNPKWHAYIVTIIPKQGKLKKPFAPKDRKPLKNLEIIDGASFYDLASDETDALKYVYDTIMEEMRQDASVLDFVLMNFNDIYGKHEG